MHRMWERQQWDWLGGWILEDLEQQIKEFGFYFEGIQALNIWDMILYVKIVWQGQIFGK